MRLTATLLLVSVTGAAILASGCSSSEKADINISYVLEPTQQIPEGLTTVAVLESGVKVEGSEDEERVKFWSKTSADLMERMIDDAAKKFGSPLQVAKRRDTAKVMAEKDMKMSGMVEGGAAEQAAKLLDVQALITSDLNIRVEVKKSKKTTIDITDIYGGGGHGWGHGGADPQAREADAIARNVTLQCKYSMVDGGTGKALFEYAPKTFRKTDSKTPAPLFGRSAGEADLDPVDQYIGELVEKGTREFVSMFVPCEVEYAYELKSGKAKSSAAGVRLLRADDFEGAREAFQAALAEEPEDHRTAFALGVTCEKMNDFEAALGYYRKAAAMPDVDEKDLQMYLAAKNRLNDHKDRIRKCSK